MPTSLSVRRDVQNVASAASNASLGSHQAGGQSPWRAHAPIVDGRPAEPGRLPWLAYIEDRRGAGTGQCTGTVVAPNLVLTAGHCAEDVHTAPQSLRRTFASLLFGMGKSPVYLKGQLGHTDATPTLNTTPARLIAAMASPSVSRPSSRAK